MRCHVCNAVVGDGQRFCHDCGQSLRGVTDATESLPRLDAPDDGDVDGDVGDDIGDGVGDDDVDADGIGGADGDGDEATPAPSPDPVAAGGGAWSTPAGAPVPNDRSPGRPEPVAPGPAEGADADTADDRRDEATAPFPATDRRDDATDPFPAADRRDDDTDPFPTAESDAGDGSRGDDRTDVIPAVGGAAAPTGSVRTTPGPDATRQMPATSPLFDGAHDVEREAAASRPGFQLRISLVLSVLALIASAMALVADVIDVRTSRPVDGIAVGLRALNDVGSNLGVAGLVGTGLMLVGAFLSCFGLRWGAGVAGGSGLATLGWAALTLGLVEVPIADAQRITRSTGADVGGFTLSVTRDIGWFLVAGVGVVGLLVFLASLRLAGSGGRGGLNPWVAALGALAAATVAVGPLIPLGGASWDVNLGTGTLPRAFFAARLVQLGLVAVAGVVGFLSVRTYGLGLVAGGLGVAVWLWATSFGEIGGAPVGLGVGNIGTSDTMPHAVTTVGVVATLTLLVVAAALALLAHRRPR